MQPLAHPPQVVSDRKVKLHECVGWDEDSLLGKAKTARAAKQNKEFIDCFPSVGRHSAAYRKLGLIMCNAILERQMFQTFQSSRRLSLLISLPVLLFSTSWYGTSLWPVWASCPVASSSYCSQPLAGRTVGEVEICLALCNWMKNLTWVSIVLLHLRK